MSFDAARTTKAARVAACSTLLPGFITAVAAEHGITLEQVADDDRTTTGKAIYNGEQTGYASPCVEILSLDDPAVQQQGDMRLSGLTGDVILSFQETDPEMVGPRQDAYLAALVRAFSSKRDGPNEYWVVEGVSQSPTLKPDTGPFTAAVAVTIRHQIAEQV